MYERAFYFALLLMKNNDSSPLFVASNQVLLKRLKVYFYPGLHVTGIISYIISTGWGGLIHFILIFLSPWNTHSECQGTARI